MVSFLAFLRQQFHKLCSGKANEYYILNMFYPVIVVNAICWDTLMTGRFSNVPAVVIKHCFVTSGRQYQLKITGVVRQTHPQASDE